MIEVREGATTGMDTLHGPVTLAVAVASIGHAIGPDHARATVVEWEMHETLLGNSTRLTRRHLDKFAEKRGLGLPRFEADLDDEIYRQRVREHQESRRRSHVRATPTCFVDDIVQDVSGGMRGRFDAIESEFSSRQPG